MYSMGLSYCDSVQVLKYKVNNNNSRNNSIYCYNSKKPFTTSSQLLIKTTCKLLRALTREDGLTLNAPPSAEGVNRGLGALRAP